METKTHQSIAIFVQNCVTACRPWSLTASLIPALLGVIVAYGDRKEVNAILSTFTILCVLFVHLGGNLINTYFDYVNEIDVKKTSADRTLVDGLLSPTNVLLLAASFYGTSLLLLFVLIGFAGIDVTSATIFLAGLALSFFYTGSVGLKYYALGDVVICLAFGPIIASFTYCAGSLLLLSWKPIFISLPVVVITESMLHINNLRDLKEDRKRDIWTIPILLGEDISCYLYIAQLLMPFLCLVYRIVALGECWYFLPLLSFYQIRKLSKKCMSKKFSNIVEDTAGFHFVFGTLYLLSVYLSSIP